MPAKPSPSPLLVILIPIVIVVLLIALLVPAVQKTREARQDYKTRIQPHQAEFVYSHQAELVHLEEKDKEGKKEDPGLPQKQDVQRKIIYTAEIQVVIEDLDKTQVVLEQVIKENQGLIAQSEIQGTSGAPRSGRWKVRMPVENFDTFRAAVLKLGEVIRNRVDSQDVTEEYYDVKQRIKNKKVQEDRLLEHLKKSTSNLKDTLDVERELARVREEVERLQGRMNLLENLVSLTTITVQLQERRGYIPPESPSLITSIGRTFSGSLELLGQTGRVLVLSVVALGPWLVVLAVVLGPFWWLLRKRWHSATKSESPAD